MVLTERGTAWCGQNKIELISEGESLLQFRDFCNVVMDSVNIALYISKLSEYSRTAYVCEDFIDCDNTQLRRSLSEGTCFRFQVK